MRNLTLYFAPGACSRVAMIALETVGVPFDAELVTFMNGAHKSPAFKRLNPSSKIPVLVVDGTPISQNISILMWLHETYPNANLLPKAEMGIKRTQQLSALSLFSSDLHPLVSRIRVPQFFCDIEGGPDRVRSMAEAAMREQLIPIQARLASHAWVGGQTWSVLDAYLHWVWFRITGAGFDPSDFPHIASHYEKTLAKPAVQRAIAREAEANVYLESKGLKPAFLEFKPHPANASRAQLATRS